MGNNEINTKPRRIDTDLTAAYLRAIQEELEVADQSIADLIDREHDWEELYKGLYEKDKEIETLKEQLSNQSAQVEWHPATEMPQDNQRVIVRTHDGATFMLEPVGKKWPSNIYKWMYIPQ